LPESIEDLETLLESAKSQSNVSMTWTESSSSSTGVTKFYEKEVTEDIEWTAYEEPESYYLYHGYDGSFYYDISTKSTDKRATKYRINDEASTSSTTEVTSETAASRSKKIDHDVADWFIEKSRETFTSSAILSDYTKFTAEKNEAGDGYTVVVTSVTDGRLTYSSTYEFDAENHLLGGEYLSQLWSEDDFDSETHTVKNPDTATPTSENRRTSKITIGEVPSSDTLHGDVPSYFISSLDDVYVTTYYDEDHKNQCEAGKLISLYINAYTPSTALDSRSYGITKSSDPTVVEVSGGFATALKAGTATLTVSDAFGTATKDLEVTVTTPALTSVYLSESSLSLQVGASGTATVSAYPAEAEWDFTAASSDTAVATASLSDDQKTLTVTGVAAGTATITVASASNANISDTLEVTVVQPSSDTDWLIGTWTWSNSTFSCTMVLNEDGTGTMKQEVTDVAIANEATFSWTLSDSGLAFSSWTGDDDDTIKAPTSIVVADDHSTITVTAKSMNADEDYEDLVMAYTKETPAIDTTWLIGTWSGTDLDDYEYHFTFSSDGTGYYTIDSGTYKNTFSWAYDGTTLSFTEWSSTTIDKPTSVTINSAKTEIDIPLYSDDETLGTVRLSKDA
jgi:hypothetical protein